MNKANKILIAMFIFSFFLIILGSLSKINHYSFDWMLTIGFIMKPLIVFTLIVYNFDKLKMLFK